MACEATLLTADLNAANAQLSPGCLRADGFQALKKALEDPQAALAQIKASGLRGRSGSGFPTGAKWEMVKNAADGQKYIICNADEGEPGTCKDRLLLMRTPYAVIEGILIAGVCTGADRGYVYVRGEYRDAIEVMQKAIDNAYAAGALGRQIFGSSFCFELELRCGAGSYLCGEETALLESLEGRRGEARIKPPYPGSSGLWGRPTLINNVETLANIPVILKIGADAYRVYGTKDCPGTKLVTVSGCVKRPGVYEVTIGAPISEILALAGGCRDGEKLLAVQTGGGSGPILPVSVLEVPFDPESCQAAGAFFGAGDLMFIGSEANLLQLCDRITDFFQEESCGRCVPCRIGLPTVRKHLRHFLNGTARDGEADQLLQLAEDIRTSARCALGTAAVSPVLSVLKNFPDLFEQTDGQEGW